MDCHARANPRARVHGMWGGAVGCQRVAQWAGVVKIKNIFLIKVHQPDFNFYHFFVKMYLNQNKKIREIL